jgi:hypothetical protein
MMKVQREWKYSSTAQPLYPKYKLNRKLGGCQSWTGCFGEDKNVTTARN